jgi:hypothetical protein
MNCFICAKKLFGLYVIDAKHCLSPHLAKNKFTLSFKDFHTCVPCGTQLFKWNRTKNKIKLLKNRAIGIPIKLKPCLQEQCIMCKQPGPLKFYIKPVGKCCASCYMAMHNTSC